MTKYKKIIIILLLLIILIISGIFYYYKNLHIYIIPTTEDNTSMTGSYSGEQSLSKEEKLEQLKRRMNFRSIIRKGDFYNIKNMKETALQYYLNAYKRLRDDHIIEKKIGDTYFEMKMFSKAYQFYSKIPGGEMDEKMKDKLFKTLLYTGNKNMRDEYNKIQAPIKIKEYYDKILVCYTGIRNCVTELKSYTGSNEKINTIKNDIANFEKIENTDSNSKYAIIAGDFMKNKDYLATALIGQETLSKRPNYSSVLKLVGFARYELGDYKKSNNYLQKYYQIEPKDITVTYLLGIINFYLENYISSNLYLNAAVINGYSPKTELQKRLAYNYYIIGDKKNMLKVFRYILDEDDVTQEDYSVALYTAIEEKEYSKAMLWANKGIIKFPQSDMLYAFRGWLYNLRNEEINALNDLNLAIGMNKKNAVALYNLGILAFGKNDYTIARKYFEDTLNVDKNGTFGDKAEARLLEIKQKGVELESSSGSIKDS